MTRTETAEAGAKPATSPAFRFRPRAFELDPAFEPAALLPGLARRRPVLLDSAAGAPRRFSLIGFDPLGGVDLPTALPELRSTVARLTLEGDAPPGPFAGGFLGALAYDLGVVGEKLDLPREPWGQPLLVGGLYTDFVVRDEQAERVWLVLGDEPGDERPTVGARRRELEELFGSLPGDPAAPLAVSELVRHVPSAEHRERIERARAYVAAGEIYQANLAHRFTAAVEAEPAELYRSLRAANPAPYMGYCGWEGGALLSSSPELLLELDAARRVARTRPIKGTIARSADPDEDRRARETLLASEKDRAELGMIVDLERNDLGRIAAPGTVAVEGFPTLETYAAVHHLVADVTAEPRAGTDAVDVLAALFPGGSVTGAPKLRSMEVIAELEGEGRGFFCGSLGFLDTAGNALFNILIRTLLWRPGEVSYRVGGGITWSSDARAEDEETLAKGAALARALGAP